MNRGPFMAGLIPPIHVLALVSLTSAVGGRHHDKPVNRRALLGADRPAFERERLQSGSGDGVAQILLTMSKAQGRQQCHAAVGMRLDGECNKATGRQHTGNVGENRS